MKKSILIAATLLISIACNKGKNNNAEYMAACDCTGLAPSYNANIKPLYDLKCATSGCHNAATAKSGLKLDTYQNAKDGFAANNTLCAVNQGSGCGHMPLGGVKLTEAEIKNITCWAKNGFPQ
ncbi:MAG: hypothetical protein EXR21_07625 [Flavobacteriaceae bacterium]|nr:hypothetical protein [Flavobacteriaceae bacterium]